MPIKETDPYVAWIITEAIEEAVVLNRLTREEARYYYDVLGTRCYLWDLLPGKLKPEFSDVEAMLKWIRSRLREDARHCQRKEKTMAYEAVVVGLHPEKTPPDDYLTKLLGYDTCLCIAYVDSDGSIAISSDNGTTDVAGFKEMVKEIPNEKVIMVGKSDKDYPKDDLQPFILLEENYNLGENKSEQKPTLVCFAEGNFNFGHDDKSEHSPAFFMLEEYLRDEVNALWADCETLEMLVKKMDEPKFRKKIQLAIEDRGAVTFVAGVEVEKGGKIWSVAKNPLAGSAPWGWTTNHLGFQLGDQAAPAVAEGAKSSWRKGKGDGAAGVLGLPSVPQVVPPKTDTKVPDDAGKEMIHYPPAEIRGDLKLLKDWFTKNYKPENPYPQGWKSGTAGIKESMLHPKSALRALKSTTEDKTTPPKTAGMTAGVQPTMSPEQQKQLEDFLAKLNPPPETVEDVKAQEKEFPTIWDRTGKTLQDYLRMSFQTYNNMGHLSIVNLALLCRDLRNEILDLNPNILDKDGEAEEAAGDKAGKAVDAAASTWRKSKKSA